MKLPLRVLTLIALAICCAQPALADPSTAEKEKEAKRLYDEGTNHFHLAEYPAAIEAYKNAYRTVANPYFLYNIAQAERLNGDSREALKMYKSYLAAKPDAQNRAEVEKHISELEAVIQKEDAEKQKAPQDVKPPDEPDKHKPDDGSKPLPPAPPPPVVHHDESSPIYKKWWFWTGVGVVAVGAGVIAYSATSGGTSGPPSTDLGNFVVRF